MPSRKPLPDRDALFVTLRFLVEQGAANKSLRKSGGLSMTALAESIGIPRSTLWGYLHSRGGKPPREIPDRIVRRTVAVAAQRVKRVKSIAEQRGKSEQFRQPARQPLPVSWHRWHAPPGGGLSSIIVADVAGLPVDTIVHVIMSRWSELKGSGRNWIVRWNAMIELQFATDGERGRIREPDEDSLIRHVARWMPAVPFVSHITNTFARARERVLDGIERDRNKMRDEYPIVQISFIPAAGEARKARKFTKRRGKF